VLDHRREAAGITGVGTVAADGMTDMAIATSLVGAGAVIRSADQERYARCTDALKSHNLLEIRKLSKGQSSNQWLNER
jgi:hypothetical protein